MAHKWHARQLGADRAGLDDFAGGEKSRLSLPSPIHLRQAAAQPLRRQRAVERLHRLGPRPVFELFDEIIRAYPQLAGDIDARLDRYTARLTPDLLRVTGADRFPAAPLRAIEGGR